VPPRRSRGGDDQRIALAHGQYVVWYTAPLEQFFCVELRMRRTAAIDRARAALHSFSMPKPELLETFPNPYPGRDYEIAMECPEFTALCPLGGIESDADELRALHGGAPDFGTMYITYVPGDVCVELKSLKLYLWSFRDDGIFYERAVNRILDDLSNATKPRWMEVVGDFNIRGGIKSVIRARVGARHAS
jgi:7-cyano-7-deazaguanine reductase